MYNQIWKAYNGVMNQVNQNNDKDYYLHFQSKIYGTCKQIYLLQMIRAIDKVPMTRMELLQAHSAHSSPIKHNIKISNQKFPADFFSDQKKLSKSKVVSRMQPQSHQAIRASLDRNQVKRRQMSTALNVRPKNEDWDEHLIMSVISTAREMKKIIRKHSIELRKQRSSKNGDNGLQLPPLILKRGNTLAF